MEIKKSISAGIVIFSGDMVLLGHPTNQPDNKWNLPKGKVEMNETMMEAAIRETVEETGLMYAPSELKDCGLFNYNKYKDLYLFATRHDAMYNPAPNIEDCMCSSMVRMTNEEGNRISFPEFDDFLWCAMKDLKKFVSYGIERIIRDIREKI